MYTISLAFLSLYSIFFFLLPHAFFLLEVSVNHENLDASSGTLDLLGHEGDVVDTKKVGIFR